MSYTQHINASQEIVARCAVVTLSDTRNESTDKSGARIKELLTEQHHTIARYQILPDDPAKLESLLSDLLSDVDVDLILTNGGTGISKRDQTIGVIEKNLTQ